MAVNQKHWYGLKRDGRTLFWRARLLSDKRLAVCVVGSSAFKSGCTGQRLLFTLPRDCTASPLVLRYVLSATPWFTGAPGLPHVEVDSAVEAQAATIARRLRPMTHDGNTSPEAPGPARESNCTLPTDR